MRWRRRQRGIRPISMQKLIRLLDCEVLWGAKRLAEAKVTGCFAADLMSDVLAFSKPGVVLLTGLASIQSVHTADVAEMQCVIYVSEKQPAEGVLELAQKKEIPLLRTHHNMFDACGILYKAGLRATLK